MPTSHNHSNKSVVGQKGLSRPAMGIGKTMAGAQIFEQAAVDLMTI